MPLVFSVVVMQAFGPGLRHFPFLLPPLYKKAGSDMGQAAAPSTAGKGIVNHKKGKVAGSFSAPFFRKERRGSAMRGFLLANRLQPG